MRLHKHLDKLRHIFRGRTAISSCPQITQSKDSVQDLRPSLAVARRDSLDALTVTLLRDSARLVPKKNAVAFIGVGNVWDSTVYACSALAKLQNQLSELQQLQYVYICRNKKEYEFLKKRNIRCELWKHQVPLVQFLLESRWTVLSNHVFSNPGDCLLNACISGSQKLQLWHGYPAKSIGYDSVKFNNSIHFVSRLVEDTVSVNAVTTPSRHPECATLYRKAFPNAEQFVTGDPRTDPLFQSAPPEMLDQALQQWLRQNKGRKKIVFMPTFRDGKEAGLAYHRQMMAFLEQILERAPDVAVAVKLHPAVHNFLRIKEADLLARLPSLHVLDTFGTNTYEILPYFDALLTDFSSIRFDFLALEKPIFLWRPDALQRANLEGIFARLDALAYTIPPEHPDLSLLSDLITRDPLRDQRAALAREVHAYRDGKSSQRVAELIGQLVTKGLPATQT
jgi:CDP-glycerol glycerophosphotransferase (TagB/SpsB family)